MKPVHIVGGGLAGLALAVRLRREEVPVRVSDAGHYPRHRVCGEFLSGVSDAILDELGIRDLLDDAPSLCSTAWYSGRGRFNAAELPSPARGISRYTFDRRLANRVRETGGEVAEGERVRLEREGEPGVVVATGREPQRDSEWLGLKAHYADLDLESDLEMHLGNDGYLGLCEIEGDQVNVCGLFRVRRDLAVTKTTALDAHLRACGLECLADRLAGATVDPDSCVAVNAFGFGPQPGHASGELRVGDRFSVIGPFTGHGMSMALEGAARIAPFLVRFSRGEWGWWETREAAGLELKSAFRRRLRMSAAMHPFLTNPCGQRVFEATARGGILPFGAILRWVR